MKSSILNSLAACATFSMVLAAPAIFQPEDAPVTLENNATFSIPRMAAPAALQRRNNKCSAPVVLEDNAFATRQLFAQPIYAEQVREAVTRIADPDLARRAAFIGDVGTFMWIDQKNAIPGIGTMIRSVPCTHILGLVIYDLPGRDCGGDASGGEYETGELARYKSEYIDPIRRILVANPNVAVALIIEPDSLPNAITSLIHPRCAASVQEYKDGIAYAIAQFDLPNVVQYIDAGNGNWLGWDPNVAPAAKVIADVWKAAGKPKSVKGIATNVSNWNAWSMIPGEFESFKDSQYNKAQDEKRYIHLLGAQIAANGMPNHAIVDTSRNGRTGLRTYGGNWCNVKGAGFGVRPTSETDDDLCDAFVWVKPGGTSDGNSDPSEPRYDPTCGNADAFKPSPDAGLWNQAQFEQLVANAAPDLYTTDGRCHANIFCGSWPAGSCCDNGVCGTSCGKTCTSGCGTPAPTVDDDSYSYGDEFIRHGTNYKPPGDTGFANPNDRDMCENIQGHYNFPYVYNDPANNLHWMSIPCTIAEVVNVGNDFSNKQMWATANAQDALYQAWLCWTNPAGHPGLHDLSFSGHIFNYFHGDKDQECSLFGHSCVAQTCTESTHAAGFMIMDSFAALYEVHKSIRDAFEDVWATLSITMLDGALSTFSPNIQKDPLKWLKLALDVIGLGFALAAAPVWNIALKNSPRWSGQAANNLGVLKDSTNSMVSGGITIIKDSIEPAKTVQGASNQLHYMVKSLKEQWEAASEASLATLFDPSSEHFNQLLSLVDEGAVMKTLRQDPQVTKKHIERGYWATVIPWAWSLSNDQHHPFIMMPNGYPFTECDDTSDLEHYATGDALKKAKLCYEYSAYFLVTAKDGCNGCNSDCHTVFHDGTECTYNLFRSVPGIDDLIPEDNKWGITRDEIILGSLRSWQKFGNGYKVNSYDGFGDDGGVIESGFWALPVCTAEEAWANQGKNGMKDNPNYPCNP